MELIDWGTICQPRVCEGLGLRHLQDQNTSFLLKLAVNLISNKYALWVRVLHSKYGMKEVIPESITRGSCSAMWREITKVWPLLKENLCLSVGTITKIWCWEDSWIPKVGPLIKHVPVPNRQTDNCKLNDMVTEGGIWNLEAFR